MSFFVFHLGLHLQVSSALVCVITCLFNQVAVYPGLNYSHFCSIWVSFTRSVQQRWEIFYHFFSRFVFSLSSYGSWRHDKKSNIKKHREENNANSGSFSFYLIVVLLVGRAKLLLCFRFTFWSYHGALKKWKV